VTIRISCTSPRTARDPAAAARIAGVRAGRSTAAIGGARLIYLRSGGCSGSTCACAGSTAATRPVPAAPSPRASPNCSDPTPAAPAGWPRPRDGSEWRSGAKAVRGCFSTCPCRQARIRCCAWFETCRCLSRSRRASWAWMTGHYARDARTARSWWTWNAAACWTCSRIVRPRRWPTGCVASRRSRWRPVTARPSTPAASPWARRERPRWPTAGTCWPTCGRRSSDGWPGRTLGCGACRPGPTPPPTRDRERGPGPSGAPGLRPRPVTAVGRGGSRSTRRSGGGTPRAKSSSRSAGRWASRSGRCASTPTPRVSRCPRPGRSGPAS
jgi:hypothetical protein